ncbi:RapZ C-terminal domain-containing protein [Streptomyces acidiscabies]|uniref:RapZ C-terminal domain-containing protein n=1 Tax=Streptomyces acidiscabies TaxID=42234 RepID=UPI00073E973E|nr:RNase adapter RapZ [Streptomyces acidiscabies]GAQ52088.1 GlmZ(sRNA-inactivating NTPase [Streptomyces acidiscabies]
MASTDLQSLVRVISFGFGHTGALDEATGEPLVPPQADITLDLRRSLKNPHHDPAMRYLTGLDEVVYEHVRNTPGAELLAHNTALAAHTLLGQARLAAFTVATGCAGGRHRAVGMARMVHGALMEYSRAGGYQVELVHRDVHRDVLPSSKHV